MGNEGGENGLTDAIHSFLSGGLRATPTSKDWPYALPKMNKTGHVEEKQEL